MALKALRLVLFLVWWDSGLVTFTSLSGVRRTSQGVTEKGVLPATIPLSRGLGVLLCPSTHPSIGGSGLPCKVA